MVTDLNSEFTHFYLVIRLSIVEQSAMRFISLFESPAVPVVPGIPVMRILSSDATPNCQKPPFLQLFPHLPGEGC